VPAPDTAGAATAAASGRRAPGRPRGSGSDPAAADRLLRTAAALFAEHGFEAVGVRAIAAAAGVSSAMVAYYFGGKQGLLEAVLERGTGRLLHALEHAASAQATPGGVPVAGEAGGGRPARGRGARRQAALRGDGTGAGAAMPAGRTADSDAVLAPLAAFIEHYLGVLGDEPWLPRLIVREVVSRDTPLRARFVRSFAARAARIAPALVRGAAVRGALRADLHPVHAVLSLVGMCVFPFIAAPVLGGVLGFRADAAFARGYARHVQALFLDGARRRPA
jgi:AcrR family transcriptional regulator